MEYGNDGIELNFATQQLQMDPYPKSNQILHSPSRIMMNDVCPTLQQRYHINCTGRIQFH